MAHTLVVHPDFKEYEQQLRVVLDNFEQSGTALVETGRNHIRKVELGGEVLTIKRFKTPNLFNGLVYRYLRKSKARRSYEYALRLSGLGIGTPQPIAYSEELGLTLRTSFYICHFLDYDLDFRVLNHNPLYPDREGVLRAVTRFTYQMHQNNINFLDHSPGNTLIKKDEGGGYHCYLIDLNRMRFEKLSFKQRMRNFRRLWPSKTMLRIMSDEYAKLSVRTFEETHHWMSYYARKFMRKANTKKLRRRGRRSGEQ
jgi:hypothetical protein